MLAITDRFLDAQTVAVLVELQRELDLISDYPARVEHAAALWKTKTSTIRRRTAFQSVRTALSHMCIGPVRCVYCEDSLADEIEHIRPKSYFPDLCFVWSNYVFACGPCNGPKGSRYGYVRGETVVEVKRRAMDPVVAPPDLPSALIDPRREDPTVFLEMDLGGVTPEGIVIDPTFELIPAEGLNALDT